jgi:hypothetical protein
MNLGNMRASLRRLKSRARSRQGALTHLHNGGMAASDRRRAARYQQVKDRAKARSAAITLAGQDIAPLPRIGDSNRRVRADRDFKSFCESYFPHLFTLTWSQDHLRVIAKTRLR